MFELESSKVLLMDGQGMFAVGQLVLGGTECNASLINLDLLQVPGVASGANRVLQLLELGS